MSERRRYSRIRVQKAAKIVIGTWSVLDCVVRDLSSTGARIEVQDAPNLPDAVDMTFDGGRTFRPCRLRWRSPTETGVEFFEGMQAA
jgi:PilZ domain-containing protein